MMTAIETESLGFATCVSMYAGETNDGGGVKVGGRVFVATTTNCAASVGSIVAVAGGTGVGGGPAICNVPGETCTSGEYTQP